MNERNAHKKRRERNLIFIIFVVAFHGFKHIENFMSFSNKKHQQQKTV